MKKKKDSDYKNTDSKNKSIKLPSIKEEKATKESSSGKSRSKMKIKQEPLASPKKEEDKNEDDKKPIGIPVEAINIDNYTAVDPLTVAQELKEDETVELSAMKELRNKNKQKLIDENLEGPYCLCRKGIDGFMIRCNLCFNWYHTSCICPPKTVHGKSIGKGYNSWSASREVHYLCTLCCRSRRPRLDNILQLLMSLQKLPVRVPEGEALQFLTERAMNWQDRAKQALENVEIARILTEARSQAEKLIAEKQAAVPNSAGHSGTQLNVIFYQKLLMVKKVHKEKKLESKTNVSELTLPSDVEMKTTTINTTTDSTDKVGTSKEEPSTTLEDSTKTDQRQPTSSLAATTDKPKGDELPADLECTEEMISGSPEASNNKALTPSSNPSTSDPNVVRIHSESSSRAQSPIDVCTPLESLTTATASLKPLSSPPSTQPPTATSVTSSQPKNNTLIMHELDEELLDQLEELMFEGELLEVGLDEVQQIWAILQIQRPLSKDACNVMVRELSLSLSNQIPRPLFFSILNIDDIGYLLWIGH